MIPRLFTTFGIDYVQWKAITKAALLIDLRASMFVRGPRGQQTRAMGAVVSQLVFYSVMGGFVAAFVIFAGDLFLSANIVLGYLMFMVGTAALLDHNAVITSADDHNILGFRPVASRTYFAARMANVLVYTTVMTTLFAYLPAGAFFFRGGAAVGFAALAAIYGASIFMALAMVATFSSLLRVVGAQRVKRALSYLQFAFSFLVYGGYFLMSRVLTRNVLASLALPKTTALLLAPPSWFASYVELAAGRHATFDLAAAVISLVAIAGLASVIGGRLSLEYAERLGSLASATAVREPAKPVKSRAGLLFTSGEARAIAMLIRSQFKNDMKFRMSVLAILPLTIIYLMMGISRSGLIADPFEAEFFTGSRGAPGASSQGLRMVTLAMMMFPAMLKMNLGRSDAFRASWIFFACPADRTRLIRAAKNVVVVTFLAPYIAVVAAVAGYFSPNVLHLVIHLTMIGLLGHLVLQVITLVDPELPFSKPLAKGRSSTRVFVLSFCVAIGAMFFPLVAPVIYRTPIAILAAFTAVIGISVALERLTRVRVEAQSGKLEFEG